MLKILEEVSKEELKEVLHIFQKDKESWFGWVLIEFFIGFYKVIEDDPMKVIQESSFQTWIEYNIIGRLQRHISI